jgi:hypothetical protein
MKSFIFGVLGAAFICLNISVYAQSELLIEGSANQGVQVANTSNSDVSLLTSSKLDITSSLANEGISLYQTNKQNRSWLLLQNDPGQAGPLVRISINGDQGLFNPGDAELEVNAGIGNVGGDLNLKVDGYVGLNQENPSADFHIKQSVDGDGGGLRLERSTFGPGNYWEIHTYSDDDLVFEYNNVLKAWLDQGTGANLITSDRRLKKDISVLPSILHKIGQLSVVSYHYLDQSSEEPEVFGFVAQDIEKVFPNLVDTKNGIKGLNISGFGVIAIKGIQEQQLMIENHEKKIEALLEENKRLESLLSQLEKSIAKLFSEK